ncbi:hypothetical protein [Sporolactobacillus terrae]|uniref:hypothetical protein n=1 Tax=Sporolactobacillus terrae TaxID=269673 RepID=UPI000491D3CB|nr:hypothetical protein [Sporolactobacillus terrae]
MENKKTTVLIALTAICLFTSTLFFAYRVIGKPVNLHHAVNRVFDDRIDYYNLKNGVLTVKSDNFGWDGTGWSVKHARRNGLRQIEKLQKVVLEYEPGVKKINVTITYLKKPEIKKSIVIKR